jgi:gliding-associated putative ABC transporter substrate-binding component GldG
MKTRNLNITIALVVGILILINLLSEHYFFRLDLTEQKQYTLSRATKDILRDLKEPVTVTAYFSKDLPSQLIKTRNDFREMLVEYGKLSGQMVVYEFVSPNEDEELETQAMQNGIQPVVINVREKDQMQQQRAYMGAVLSLGERKEIIPLVEPGLAMEYTRSTAIKKLSVIDKPTVGFLTGHGEASIQELAQASQELGVLYSLESIRLNDTTAVPSYIETMAIVRPVDSIPPSAFIQLDRFMARGGKLFVAVNRVKGDLQTGYGSGLTTGLESWLREKGLFVNENFLIDENCVTATMQQQIGNAIQISSVAIPYVPRVNRFGDHPVTQGLEEVILPFVSTIDFMGDSSLKFTPILISSDLSGTERTPAYFNFQRRWRQSDFPLQGQVLGGVIEGPISGGTDGKMVVIGDGDFAVNENGQQVNPDNISLLVNGIDWLSDDTGLIELRTKGVTSRPIRQMEDGTRILIKWLNFLLPILLVLIYGAVRYQYRKNQRIARMEADFS